MATYTFIYQPVPEGFIGYVEELPGANTQGATLEETQQRLAEAVALILDAEDVAEAERSLSSTPDVEWIHWADLKSQLEDR